MAGAGQAWPAGWSVTPAVDRGLSPRGWDPIQISLSGQGHTPDCGHSGELLGTSHFQEAPGSFGKDSGRFSIALCSVLPSVLTCVGGKSCDGKRKSVFSFVHLMKLTSPISGAPFGAGPP